MGKPNKLNIYHRKSSGIWTADDNIKSWEM